MKIVTQEELKQVRVMCDNNTPEQLMELHKDAESGDIPLCIELKMIGYLVTDKKKNHWEHHNKMITDLEGNEIGFHTIKQCYCKLLDRHFLCNSYSCKK